MVRQVVVKKDSVTGAVRPVKVEPPHLALSFPCRHLRDQIATGRCKPCKNKGVTSIPVHHCTRHEACTINGEKVIADLGDGPEEITTKCTACTDYDPVAVIAPAHRYDGTPMWHGVSKPHPWEYAVTAVIPHLDTPEELELAIELLQLQTVKPYVIVIDTGSRPEYLERVEALRSWSVEVHSLRFNGVKHSSDLPAIAMDLALAMCRTPWMYCTHADVFPMRRDLLAALMSQTDGAAAIGYRMSRRAHPDWERMVSHTCTLLHVPTMDRIGAGWNLRRCCELFGDPREHSRQVKRWDNWPDTEVLINNLMWDAGFTPENGGVKLIGDEENMQRTLDANIDHCRSLTVARLYSSDDYRKKADGWATDALQSGRERAKEWRLSSNSDRSDKSDARK